MKHHIALCILCLSGLCFAETAHELLPEYLADPFILTTDDGYYLYATGYVDEDKAIPVYRSDDMVNWQFVRAAVAVNPDPSAWNHKNFWAPEVFAWDGKYYLYYTASPGTTPRNEGNRIGLAVADHPAGPFVDQGPVVLHGSLDATVVHDEQGQAYMAYALELNNGTGLGEGVIVIDRMLSPSRLVGKPRLLFNAHGWQEAPNFIHRSGRYFMLYSEGPWREPAYATRLAVSATLAGPFAEIKAYSPALTTLPGMQGPGHGHYFKDRKGQEFFVYHAWDARMKRRSPRLARLQWEGAGLVLTPVASPAALLQ
ncbi:glycoside hydrolase family 43 protein [Simiduia agarivorans]|uniref:Glycoside hydrolase n=1 Tax=Simiduia agarivorans (strain DSM 21679 / JCM 13881 / BCRC 17597 / SA1) TaxID=1117647 RepID=K4KMQ6_SIMAS|nr:glycoside hydrolase family 43 protein [Simiduia agarivorans]AFV00460.1 glycoside hydrolase [Simiduia agarivorans SA1 = DSM 21679]